MNVAGKKKIVILGMMSRMPVAGVVWQNIHYLLGLQRLGYDPYYIDGFGIMPTIFMTGEDDDPAPKAAAFIDRVMRRIDMGDKWSYRTAYEDSPRYFGLSDTQVAELYSSAHLIINLHGCVIPQPEHYATNRLVYLETDPVAVEIELYHNRQETVEYLKPHCAFFTFGENYGRKGCRLPVDSRFTFKPTRQPVVMDLWDAHAFGPGEMFTTIGNWKQADRQVVFRGEVFHWSKHYEFIKFLDLPKKSRRSFELALGSYDEKARAGLESRGWRVRAAADISADPDVYREYIQRSRGEFTVAKDQNIRLRSGWFSDRTATYLAAGRPAVVQDTGFDEIIPTGCGLFSFQTMRDAVRALDEINADYEKHRRGALEIAREYFNYDKVLPKLLSEVGV
jgi:hypothetical protein